MLYWLHASSRHFIALRQVVTAMMFGILSSYFGYNACKDIGISIPPRKPTGCGIMYNKAGIKYQDTEKKDTPMTKAGALAYCFDTSFETF